MFFEDVIIKSIQSQNLTISGFEQLVEYMKKLLRFPIYVEIEYRIKTIKELKYNEFRLKILRTLLSTKSNIFEINRGDSNIFGRQNGWCDYYNYDSCNKYVIEGISIPTSISFLNCWRGGKLGVNILAKVNIEKAYTLNINQVKSVKEKENV